MRTLIFGAEGLLGTATREVAARDPRVGELLPLGRADADVTDKAAVDRVVADFRPDLVINTSVLMPADRCDDEPEQAYEVNALGSRWVSRAAAAQHATVVYITTDFVYDGESPEPYLPDAVARPVLTYGITKLAGEHEARLGNPDNHLVLRTAGLFGPRPISPRARACFADRVLDRALGGDDLHVVDNIRMSPTYTRDLAGMIIALAADHAPSGTYHAVNSGPATWYDVCHAALAEFGITDRVSPTDSSAYTAAARPPSTPLTATLPVPHDKLSRPWRTALHEYLSTSRPDPAAARPASAHA